MAVDPVSSTRRSWVQPAILVAVIAALLLPVALDSDDLPLSTYPMYSRARPADVSFVTAQGVDASGNVVPLGLGLIGASDDPLVVAGELRAAVQAGRAAERCAEIRERWLDQQPGDAELAVRVVTERHDVIAHTRDLPSLIDRTVHAECREPT